MSISFGKGRMSPENEVGQAERVLVSGPSAHDANHDQRDLPPERLETAHLRQSPNFIIIGTQRGGTTSLYHYLTAHPNVGEAYRKEVHFFDRYFDKGWDWYLAHFPLRDEFPVVGEASPYYVFHPEVPQRILAAMPDVRFILLLRNPIDRALSQYNMKFRRGYETLPFDEAIAREPERLAVSDDPISLAQRHHSYLARGVYVDQLERWFACFPRDRFLIIKSEEFYSDPERLLHQSQEFLGLPPHTPTEFKAYHQRKYEDMDPIMRQRLADYFAPHNQRLYELLGRDFGWEHG